MVNELGNSYGILKVVSKYRGPLPKETMRGYVLWECQCECGNSIVVPGRWLRLGSYKSCGCQKKLLDRKTAILKVEYANLKNEAKTRNKFFDLSFEDYKNTVLGDCIYCGQSPNMLRIDFNGGKLISEETIFINSIDRVDSSLGYISSNIASCCSSCNVSKSNHSKEFYISHMRKISAYNKKPA